MNKYFGITSVILCGLLGSAQLHGYRKECKDLNPAIRYAAPFGGGRIDYTLRISKKEINGEYPRECYVQLTNKQWDYVQRKLGRYSPSTELTDKFIEKASRGKMPEASALKDVLDDFQEHVSDATVSDVLDALKR